MSAAVINTYDLLYPMHSHFAETTGTDFAKLEALARLVRYHSLRMTTLAGSGHPTSSLSAADLMTALFFDGWFRCDPVHPQHPNNDRLIFSKGHASPLYYALWYAAGQLSDDDLAHYRRIDSPLEGHPTARFPHVDAATGSLGQGLAIGVGYALNARYLDHLPYRTYVLLGDSEMAEGSQWEAIQLAAHYKLGNLIGVLDVNGLGQRGATMLGRDVDAYARRLEAFGWRTLTIDGHALPEITAAYAQLEAAPEVPTMVIARTVKGKGVRMLENQDGWHGRPLNEEQLEAALAELGDIDSTLRGEIHPPQDLQPPAATPRSADAPHYEPGTAVATRQAYGNALRRLGEQLPELVALDSEVSNSTKADLFQAAHPHRFFEMFIAEQAMVGIATGLARCGKTPFASTFAAFLTRAFDQIRMVPHSAANVKFVGSHAGVSIGADGPSQMGLEDIALFRSVPGCVVFHPCDATSTEKLVEVAATHRGPVYLRTMRQKTPILYEPGESFVIGGSKVLRSSPQEAATIVAAGTTVFEALAASDQLKVLGHDVGVIDLYCLAPVDKASLAAAVARSHLIVTVEDHYGAGGLGEAVRSALAPLPVPVFSLCVDRPPRSGKPDELRDLEGISAAAIVATVRRALGTTTGVPVAEPNDAPANPEFQGLMNPLRRLSEFGQSFWLDSLSRQLLRDGVIRRLIQQDGLGGITSNPAIFDEAITDSEAYDESIAAATGIHDPELMFERLAVADIQDAADELRGTFDSTEGRDGFVSLEVSPLLAEDTDATLRKARELWQAVARPNIYIKVPGTSAALPAIRQLIAEGININVTLLFSLERYREVVDAFLGGIEQAVRERRPVQRVSSVASFFLSRIDTAVDARLDELIARGGDEAATARQLRGRVAIASARCAYQIYRDVFHGERFRTLAGQGVRPQRLLWASTSTKSPEYSDVKYVEPLIGPETINTMPMKTIDAYRDHGEPASRLMENPEGARETLDQLASLGIDLAAVTRQLEADGLDKFERPYRNMLTHLRDKIARVKH